MHYVPEGAGKESSKMLLTGGGQDGRSVADLISSGPMNLAGYLSNHSEHPRIQSEV